MYSQININIKISTLLIAGVQYERKWTKVKKKSHRQKKNVKNPTKIIGDRNTSQNLRYKTGRSLTSSEKDNLIYNNPHNILLPKTSINSSFVFAKEDFYMVYPNNYNHFSNYFKNTYQHGGVSMEEMIIPFITLSPKQNYV